VCSYTSHRTSTERQLTWRDLLTSKLSHVNESQLRVWNPLFESKTHSESNSITSPPTHHDSSTNFCYLPKTYSRAHAGSHHRTDTQALRMQREGPARGIENHLKPIFGSKTPNFESTSSACLRRCRRAAPPLGACAGRNPFRAKVVLQIESAGSAAILGKLKVKATTCSHGNPPTARP